MRFKATEIVSLTVAFLAFLSAIVSAFYTYTNRNRELDIKIVEMGISILRADPKETQTQGAREWAIQVIERFSGETFSKEAKSELLKYKLDFQPSGYTYNPGYDSTYSPGGPRI
jgi:hypothetical protein